MNKILKFNYNERHKHYFSTDWHIYHDPAWTIPIWEQRGYLNAEDAAERILQKVNERVGEDDILWYLGDMFLNATDGQCLGWLSRLRCKNIFYLWGNHESNMFRLYKQEVERQYGFKATDGVEVYPLTMGNITFLGNYQEVQIGKQLLVVSHFPLRIWHSDQRNSVHLSGHSHLNDKGRLPSSPFQKACDIGWEFKNDVWSFDEIMDVMSTKTIEILDHNRTS